METARQIPQREPDQPNTNARPFLAPPWWQPPQIDDTTTIRKHNKLIGLPNTLSIYTNGSSIEDRVGAAAVIPATDAIRRAHMGSNTTSTVYAAELQGINMALELCQLLHIFAGGVDGAVILMGKKYGAGG
jgi:hypothetical protein